MATASLSPWIDPTQWTQNDWTALGVLVPVTLAVLGWFGSRIRRSRASRPALVWAPLHFHVADEPVRPHYPYAIGFQVTNIGDGPAIHVVIGFTDFDPNHLDEHESSVYAEVVTRDVLVPGEPLADHVGLRGPEQATDPSEDEARTFFAECLAFAACWDLRGRGPYLFFPTGGGLPRRRWWRPFDSRWPRPHELLGELYQHPSRGEEPGALGLGRKTPPTRNE